MRQATVLALVGMTALAMVAAAAAVDGPADKAEPAAKEAAVKDPSHKSPYAQWKNGPPTDPQFFPIGVWCQSPRNAPKYKAIGINVYLALWGGPTEQELADLKKHGMKTICAQNEVGLKHLDDPTIIGWMHGDEPDNCKQEGGKWVPVAKPAEIVADYRKWKRADPTRPVLLNLGQRVANDGYKGSWVKDDKTYLSFLKGCDIASYDIYPVVGNRPETNDRLWLVPLGVDRLRKWGGRRKIVWNILECTAISHPSAKPTPHQVKAEVWMSLVHGSTGIVYFCHEFNPNTGGEAALLKDPQMSQAVGEINHQIHALAAVLNAPTVGRGAVVRSSNAKVPVDVMVKRYRGDTYLFAVAMRPGSTRAAFRVSQLPGKARAEVLGEGRSIEVNGGRFADTFKPYDVHLYKITARAD